MKGSSALLAISLGLVLAAPAEANVDPGSFALEVYRIAISTSGDCSQPIVIYAPEQSTYVDLMAAPTLGQAHIDDGAYRCVMFEVAPEVVFSPATTDGACAAGASYRASLCDEGVVDVADAGDGGDAGPRPVRMLDGSATTCSTDRVVLYLSQWSNGGTSTAKPFNPFQPPTFAGDGDHGLSLFGTLAVSGGGTQIATLTVSVGGNLYSDGGTCKMYPPKIGFESAAPGDAGAPVQKK